MTSTSQKSSEWHKKIASNRGKNWRKNLIEGRRDAQLNPSNVRIARLKAGLLQEELAKKIGVSESTFGSIERGKRPVKLDVAKQICEKLKLPLHKLFFAHKGKNKYLAVINSQEI